MLFGSLLPDFQQTNALPRGFDKQSIELLKFLKKEYPDLVPLAIGMTLHEYPIGIDRLVHQSYNGKMGYGFQFNSILTEKSKKVFNCDDQTANLMNHFLVENAIEYKIITGHPETNEKLKKCFNEIDRERIIKALSKFYNSDKDSLNKEFDLFIHTNLDFNYGEYEDMGNAWVDTMERVLHKTADPKEIAILIKLTCNIIDSSVDKFLQTCVDECKKDFDYNFGTLKKSL